MASPSSLGRIQACIRSETLEAVDEITEPAHLGTVGHRFQCNVSLKGYDEALNLERPDDQAWLSGFDTTRLPSFQPEQYAPEISFAYNPATGEARELGRALSRSEARALARPDEMVGTADVAGVTESSAVIHDYKMGFGWVDPASINWQVLTYMLMAARAWGKDEADGGIIRARPDGYVWFDSFHADMFRLEQHEVELRELLAKREHVIAAAKAGEELPHFVEGPHCTYCPGRRVCPPKTAQLLALGRDAAPEPGVETSRLGGPLVDDATAVLVWQRAKFAKKMVERVEAEVKEYARRRGLPLGGGWMLAERAKTTETVVAELAVPLLEQAFGAELGQVVAGACVETTQNMTKEALNAALSRFVLPTLPKKEAKITKVKEAVLQRFREGGALSVRASRNVEEHKVEAPEKAKPLAGVNEQQNLPEGVPNGEGEKETGVADGNASGATG